MHHQDKYPSETPLQSKQLDTGSSEWVWSVNEVVIILLRSVLMWVASLPSSHMSSPSSPPATEPLGTHLMNWLVSDADGVSVPWQQLISTVCVSLYANFHYHTNHSYAPWLLSQMLCIIYYERNLKSILLYTFYAAIFKVWTPVNFF